MNLSFKVLWVEDSVDWIESVETNREDFEKHIRDSGFEPSFTVLSLPAEIEGAANTVAEFDLLLVDFNLGLQDGRNGATVVALAQQTALSAETLFYSTKPRDDLFREVAENKLEGVFVAQRSDLFDRAKSVFDLVVRKVLDVENMRGLVMAGVADVDQLSTKVLQEKHAQLSDADQLSLRIKIRAKILPNAKELVRMGATDLDDLKNRFHILLTEFDKTNPPNIESLLKRRDFHSMNRIQTIASLCKSHQYLQSFQEGATAIEETIHWRNALAHQIPTVVNGEVQFEVRNENYTFDRQSAQSLRQKILSQRQLLTKILETIKAEAKNKRSGVD